MHNIEHFEYARDVNKAGVQKRLDEYVAHEDWQEGCGGLYNPIRWLGDKVYLSRTEAQNAIEKLDRGDYDNLAVLFEHHIAPKNEKEKELRDKLADLYREYERRCSVLYVNTITSAYIGCKKCGSRLNTKYIRTNSCPVCREEMRPEHMLKSVEVAEKRWKKAGEELDAYINRKGKTEVRWLVKIEYHT